MTTEDYLNQLEQDRSDLVDNLTTKGITGLSGDETFTELVPEVLNIPSGADLSEYFEIEPTIQQSDIGSWIAKNYIKKMPTLVIPNNITKLNYLGYEFNSKSFPKLIFGNNITEMWGTCSASSSGADLYYETIDTSGWNVENVTITRDLFNNCRHITELDLSNLIFTKVTNAMNMFVNCLLLSKIDIRNFDLTTITMFTNMFGANASSGVPDNCLIIVKDQTQKDWLVTNFSRLTNVQTVAEYESSQGGE